MLRHLRTRYPLLFSALVLFVGLFIGSEWGFYSAYPSFDKLLHFAGGLAMAWLALALLQDDIVHLPAWKQVLIVVSVAAFIGVVWEFAEYVSGFTKESIPLLYRYFRGGDLADTLGDLLADIIGGSVFAFWALYKEHQ